MSCASSQATPLAKSADTPWLSPQSGKQFFGSSANVRQALGSSSVHSSTDCPRLIENGLFSCTFSPSRLNNPRRDQRESDPPTRALLPGFAHTFKRLSSSIIPSKPTVRASTINSECSPSLG